MCFLSREWSLKLSLGNCFLLDVSLFFKDILRFSKVKKQKPCSMVFLGFFGCIFTGTNSRDC